MKTKNFSIFMISIFIFAIVILFLINFIIQITLYHGLKSNWKTGQILGNDTYGVLEYKTCYLSQQNLEYDAFIFGGSKSSVINPSYINKFTKDKFYNYWTNGGCFENYEMFIKYVLLKYKNINEIIISLSSHEVEHFESNWKIVPSKIQNYPFASEIIKLKLFKEKYLNISNVIGFIRNPNLDKISFLTYSDGSCNFDLNFTKLKKNPEFYIKEKVLPSWHPRDGGWKKSLSELFYETPKLAACEKNIASLIRIKKELDIRNIKLTIIIMPTFIGEIFKYKSPDFEQYLINLTNITNIYNFGGINDVNMNPYNFADGGHCFNFVANKIVETIYSNTPNTNDMNAFGILLTPNNIKHYIDNQKQKFRILKSEFETSGTIKLYDKNDKSYLGPSLTE